MKVDITTRQELLLRDAFPGAPEIGCVLEDFAPFRGKLTVTVSDQRWAATWNSTGAESIAEFLSWLDADYLAIALSPALSPSILAPQALLRLARKTIIERRCGHSRQISALTSTQARSLFDRVLGLTTATDIKDLPGALMEEIFGPDWRLALPGAYEPNPAYLQLLEIAGAVIQAAAAGVSIGPNRNRYGIDQPYVARRLRRFLRDLADFKPDEAARELARTAAAIDRNVLGEAEFARQFQPPTGVAMKREFCQLSEGTLSCTGSGYLGSEATYNSSVLASPCPGCNTLLWLAQAKNMVTRPIAPGKPEVDAEAIWLDALRAAYQHNGNGVARALEELGEVLVPTEGGSSTRSYNAPDQAREAFGDDAAVDLIAIEMKLKMARNRARGRRGWRDRALCSTEALSLSLREHLDKGDPLDPALISMMLAIRGDLITPPVHS